MDRREFLVLYDYGQGGLWALVRAGSPEQVRRRYPQLQVFDERPPMVSDAMFAAIESGGVVDVEDPPTGWLAELAAGGEAERGGP